MRFSVTSAEKSISFSVEHHCPQCGAPITLGEEALFFVCSFCRVRSFISQEGFPRYYFSLSDTAPQDIDVFYLPYWRFKGMRYACHFSGVDARFLDLSALAMEKPPGHIPFSLGFRSQALPLKRVSNKIHGKFIRPMEFKATLQAQNSQDRPDKEDPCLVFQEDIGETASLIYSPVYLQQHRLFDGILNTPIQGMTDTGLEMLRLPLCRPEQQTHFIPGICPGCGWDLEGRSHSLVLVCRNCHTLWQARGKRLGKIRYGCVRPRHPGQAMIPFWKMQADITPIAMASYADLARMANLPRAIQAEWENQALHFWAPAFKLQPKRFLRLTTQLAIAQPTLPLEKKIRKNSHLPITLSPTEAIQSIKITLASLMRSRQDQLANLSQASVVVNAIGLVFLPFEVTRHEYCSRDLNLAIHKNILALSDNL